MEDKLNKYGFETEVLVNKLTNYLTENSPEKLEEANKLFNQIQDGIDKLKTILKK